MYSIYESIGQVTNPRHRVFSRITRLDVASHLLLSAKSAEHREKNKEQGEQVN